MPETPFQLSGDCSEEMTDTGSDRDREGASNPDAKCGPENRRATGSGGRHTKDDQRGDRTDNHCQGADTAGCDRERDERDRAANHEACR